MRRIRNIKTNGVLAALLVGAFLAGPLYADTSKASSWIGRVVVTADGELLGRIEDLALDVDEKQVLELSFQSTDSDGVDLGSSSSNASGGFASTALTLNFWYDFPTLGRIRKTG